MRYRLALSLRSPPPVFCSPPGANLLHRVTPLMALSGQPLRRNIFGSYLRVSGQSGRCPPRGAAANVADRRSTSVGASKYFLKLAAMARATVPSPTSLQPDTLDHPPVRETCDQVQARAASPSPSPPATYDLREPTSRICDFHLETELKYPPAQRAARPTGRRSHSSSASSLAPHGRNAYGSSYRQRTNPPGRCRP
jgi:hypothetical protein